MKENHPKMNDTKKHIVIIHFNFMKEIREKLTNRKNKIRMIHFNFEQNKNKINSL